MSFLRDALLVAGKDLRIERRSRNIEDVSIETRCRR